MATRDDIRAAIFGATAPPSEQVALPEIGITVTVRGMTGDERDAFEASLIVGKGKKRDVNLKNMRARLVAFCCVDDDGQRVFTDEEAARLGKTRADLLDRLFTPAQKLSGIGEDDADELGKPSPSAPLASSSSASRVN